MWFYITSLSSENPEVWPNFLLRTLYFGITNCTLDYSRRTSGLILPVLSLKLTRQQIRPFFLTVLIWGEEDLLQSLQFLSIIRTYGSQMLEILEQFCQGRGWPFRWPLIMSQILRGASSRTKEALSPTCQVL